MATVHSPFFCLALTVLLLGSCVPDGVICRRKTSPRLILWDGFRDSYNTSYHIIPLPYMCLICVERYVRMWTHDHVRSSNACQTYTPPPPSPHTPRDIPSKIAPTQNAHFLVFPLCEFSIQTTRKPLPLILGYRMLSNTHAHTHVYAPSLFIYLSCSPHSPLVRWVARTVPMRWLARPQSQQSKSCATRISSKTPPSVGGS